MIGSRLTSRGPACTFGCGSARYISFPQNSLARGGPTSSGGRVLFSGLQRFATTRRQARSEMATRNGRGTRKGGAVDSVHGGYDGLSGCVVPFEIGGP